MDLDYRNDALFFKALGDENRLRILAQLGGGELCACKLLATLHITQPTLSHHMKILCDAGVVTARRDGKWTHYAVSRESCGRVMTTLLQITDDKD